MSLIKWPLTVLIGRRAIGNTNLATVRSLADGFAYWKAYYEKSAKEKRERAAKLELIGDKEAPQVRHRANEDEEDAARCDVGIRALNWAIDELSKLKTNAS